LAVGQAVTIAKHGPAAHHTSLSNFGSRYPSGSGGVSQESEADHPARGRVGGVSDRPFRRTRSGGSGAVHSPATGCAPCRSR